MFMFVEILRELKEAYTALTLSALCDTVYIDYADIQECSTRYIKRAVTHLEFALRLAESLNVNCSDNEDVSCRTPLECVREAIASALMQDVCSTIKYVRYTLKILQSRSVK